MLDVELTEWTQHPVTVDVRPTVTKVVGCGQLQADRQIRLRVASIAFNKHHVHSKKITRNIQRLNCLQNTST